MIIAIGIVLILHGLVHIWYIVLNQGLIEFRPEMGWTGNSWILSNFLGAEVTQPLATILYGISAITLVIAGIERRAPRRGVGWGFE